MVVHEGDKITAMVECGFGRLVPGELIMIVDESDDLWKGVLDEKTLSFIAGGMVFRVESEVNYETKRRRTEKGKGETTKRVESLLIGRKDGEKYSKGDGHGGM